MFGTRGTDNPLYVTATKYDIYACGVHHERVSERACVRACVRAYVSRSGSLLGHPQ